MHISNRLLKIASHINDDEAIIDVGCDHALLDIYLATKRKLKKIVASDIMDGPLLIAQKNMDKYACRDLITLVKGDGLDKKPADIKTVILAGMGAKTIIDILKKDPVKLTTVNKIIAVPNNGFEQVRREITRLGYYIEAEELIKEKEITYLLIVFVKGFQKYSYTELVFGPHLLKKRNPLFKEYYQKEVLKKKKILTNIPKRHMIRKHKLKKEICYINKVIK